MANAELKTKKTNASVGDYIESVTDEKRRAELKRLLTLMRSATREVPKMWGEHVVGFGDYHYKYASGREGDWFKTGFSSRKENLTLYFMSGIEQYKPILSKLGKHKIGKGCLYVKSLDDIDMEVLGDLIVASTRDLARRK